VLGRLTHLSQQDRELVEGMASSIVNKLIHRTMVTLKAEVNSSNGPAFVEAARRFFHLDQLPTQGRQGDDCAERPRHLTPDPDESEHEEPEASVRKRAG
jgi:glutamyl-tRNA reductase